jgi:hypothetical protein
MCDIHALCALLPHPTPQAVSPFLRLWDPQEQARGSKQEAVGAFASEEDAARAYDCAAVQAHGPGAERNFPGEAINELPVLEQG